MPRECRGKTVPGDPYGSRASSWGDWVGRVFGAGGAKALMSRGGNWRVKPLAGESFLLGMRDKLDMIALSSWLVCMDSWNRGEGAKAGAESERERIFVGVLAMASKDEFIGPANPRGLPSSFMRAPRTAIYWTSSR